MNRAAKCGLFVAAAPVVLGALLGCKSPSHHPASKPSLVRTYSPTSGYGKPAPMSSKPTVKTPCPTPSQPKGHLTGGSATTVKTPPPGPVPHASSPAVSEVAVVAKVVVPAASSATVASASPPQSAIGQGLALTGTSDLPELLGLSVLLPAAGFGFLGAARKRAHR